MSMAKKTDAKAVEKRATPAQFVIDDGSRRVPIVNQYGDEVGEFYLNPTDIGIYERYQTMGEEVEQIMSPLSGTEKIENMEQFVEATKEIKARLFAAVDKLFGYEGAAARLFGNRHPLSPVGGAFYFQLVLELVAKEINAAFDAETEAFSANVKKYVEAVK
jgi:hypothetical protein